MKKINILMIALFMVNGASGQGSIPALSINASEQSKHQALYLKLRTLHSMENVQGMMESKEQRSLFQIFDSIYHWQWYTGWQIESKTTDIVYDENNNLVSEISKTWNGFAWVDDSRYIFTYDTNNNRTSYLYQTWHGTSWENDYQFINTYDANSNETSYYYQTWDGSAWINGWQYIFTYDANNNQTSVLYQNWNGSAWENYIEYTWTYDANNFKITDSYKNWNINGTKVTIGDSTYYYYHTALGVNEKTVPSESITVYPNPSSTSITISIPTTPTKNTFLTIFNINGQQLIQRQITEPIINVDVSGLVSGVYFVKLSNDKTMQVGKFVKQ